jgi:hypothetical protein
MTMPSTCFSPSGIARLAKWNDPLWQEVYLADEIILGGWYLWWRSQTHKATKDLSLPWCKKVRVRMWRGHLEWSKLVWILFAT